MYKAQAVNGICPSSFYACGRSCRVDKEYYIIHIRVIFIYTYKARAVNGSCLAVSTLAPDLAGRRKYTSIKHI